jgi:hypothetical protein
VTTRIPVDSPHHPGMYKTVALLSADMAGRRVFFMIEDCASDCPDDELQSVGRYFYEEHSCPTNFIPVEEIFTATEGDPHGLFKHVRSVWMTPEYLEAKDGGDMDSWIRATFPESFA